MSRDRSRALGAVDAARKVAASGQAHKAQGYLLDIQTAGAIVAVADALNETNRDRLNRMDLARAAAIAWRLVSPART